LLSAGAAWLGVRASALAGASAAASTALTGRSDTRHFIPVVTAGRRA
jgi:hypothetical protein